MNVFWHAARQQLGLRPLFIVLFLTLVIGPITYGGVVLSQHSESTSAVILGAGFISLWATVLNQAVLLVALEKAWKVLELNFCTATRPIWPYCGRVAAAAAQGALALPAAWLILGAIWGFPRVPSWTVVVLAGGLGGLGFAGLALISVGILIRFRTAPGAVNGISALVPLLTGFFFPVGTLPRFAQWLAAPLAPRWALQAVRDGSGSAAWGDLALAGVTAAASLVVGVAYLGRVERLVRTRPRATLG